MRLNTLSPAKGSRSNKKRAGRGIGSGLGKTCGRGHKGQKSRSGGNIRLGFEGGQMPLHRRVPKQGFSSRIGRYTANIPLSTLNQIQEDSTITLETLKRDGLIRKDMRRVRVYLSGSIDRPVTISSLTLSKGAREAVLAAGGKLLDEAAEAKPKQSQKGEQGD